MYMYNVHCAGGYQKTAENRLTYAPSQHTHTPLQDAVAPSLTYHPDIVSNSPDLHVKYLGYLQHHQLTGLVYFVRTFLRLAQ